MQKDASSKLSSKLQRGKKQMIKLAMIMQLWFNPKESFEACWKDPGTKPRKQKIKNESIIGKNKKT
jgi:hypothetical protein